MYVKAAQLSSMYDAKIVIILCDKDDKYFVYGTETGQKYAKNLFDNAITCPETKYTSRLNRGAGRVLKLAVDTPEPPNSIVTHISDFEIKQKYRSSVLHMHKCRLAFTDSQYGWITDKFARRLY